MAIEPSIQSDLPIPPGEYLEEVLGELGMSKDELARREADLRRRDDELRELRDELRRITGKTEGSSLQLVKELSEAGNSRAHEVRSHYETQMSDLRRSHSETVEAMRQAFAEERKAQDQRVREREDDYRRMLDRDQEPSKDVRNYVKERYASAIQLMKNIEQRKQTIEEKRRQVADIEGMINDFMRKYDDLDAAVKFEESRNGVSDRGNPQERTPDRPGGLPDMKPGCGDIQLEGFRNTRIAENRLKIEQERQ